MPTSCARFESEVDRIFARLNDDAAQSAEAIERMSGDLAALITRHQDLRTRLVNDVEPRIPEDERPAFQALLDSLDAAIDREQQLQSILDRTAADITAGNADAQRARERIEARIATAMSAVENAGSVYANDLKPILDELGRTLTAVNAELGAVAGDVASLSGATGGAASLLQNAAAQNRELAIALANAADGVERVHGMLTAAIDSGDFTQIGRIIGSNPDVLAKALAQPIGVDRIAVYPVVSFGAGMAPLYTVLSLWVGALLIAVTLRVDPPRRATEGGPELKLHEQFLGRYAIFALLGLAQSTLVFLGNILLVGLDPVHPLLFMLVGWTTSLVFTFIIYTLVVSFSDAGKALAVFLLVIQVAGAGGAYPLSLLPAVVPERQPVPACDARHRRVPGGPRRHLPGRLLDLARLAAGLPHPHAPAGAGAAQAADRLQREDGRHAAVDQAHVGRGTTATRRSTGCRAPCS